MSKSSQPDLKKVTPFICYPSINQIQFMLADKRLFIHLQGGRKLSGFLRAYDLFLNLVLDDVVEETTPAQKHRIGTVVRIIYYTNPSHSLQVVRGNSVVEVLEAPG
jgi:small nuclear ribonucleoprotein (snRNP)-like protein